MFRKWYDEVFQYLRTNRESFMTTYLVNVDKRVKRDKMGFGIDPCPYCGHQDCFKVRDGFVKCFSAGCVAHEPLGFVNALKEIVGEENYIAELEKFTGIPYPAED